MPDAVEVAAWSPQPGAQKDLISCPLPDVFFGGSRGGGKSDALLGDFLVRESKYGAHLTGLLCRRTYKELGDLIERSREIYAPLGWKFTGGDELCWRSPRGALLRLRHLDNIQDARLYKGFNNQWLGFDELDEWPDPRPLDMLFATLRSKHGVPCVRRCTGNPGGPGHAWIKKRYRPHLWKGSRDDYVYTRYQPQPEELPDLWVESVFIPARMEDNAYLSPDYEANLAISAGSRALFRAWRYGDWDVLAGAYFDVFDLARHTVDPRLVIIEPWHKRWISGDWGFNDETWLGWHALNDERKVVTYRERVFNHTIAPEIGEIIKRASLTGGLIEDGTAEYEKLSMFPFAPDAFRPGAERTIADEIGDVLREAGLPPPTRAIDDRISGWQLLYQLLATDHWTISQDCPYLIEALPLMMRDDDKPNDIADHPMDHGPDGARYGLKTFLTPAAEPIENEIRRRVNAPESAPTDRMLQRLKAENELRRPARPQQNRRRYF